MARFRDEQGTSLVLVILTGLILSVLGVVTVSTVITDARSSAGYLCATQAFWLAESGIELARHWLRFQDPPPASTTPFVQYDRVQAGAGTYTVSIEPDEANATTYLKKYKILSVGEVGTIQRKIEVEVEATTFNYYAYLTGSEGGTIWFHGGDVVEGPTHSNDRISITQNPVFMGKVTSSASSFNRGRPYHPDFQQGYQLGVPPVIFPTQQDVINNFSSSNGELPGLTIDATGAKHASIEFHGDGTLTYNVWHSGRRGVKIFDARDVLVSVAQSKGLIWVNGEVRVCGALHGQVTVVSTGSMFITDDLRYACADADGMPAQDCTDLVGLISFRDIVVKDNAANRNNVVISGALLTLGDSFRVENYNWGTPRGRLTIWGSLSQKVRGPVGTFSWSGGWRTGYQKDYHYDSRLAESPPPYFPSTGQYHFTYWKEVTK